MGLVAARCADCGAALIYCIDGEDAPEVTVLCPPCGFRERASLASSAALETWRITQSLGCVGGAAVSELRASLQDALAELNDLTRRLQDEARRE